MAHNQYTKPLFQPPSRSPNGLGTHERASLKGLYGLPDPTKKWFTDACDFRAGELTTLWASVSGVGSPAAAQIAAAGGQVTLTTSASSSDSAALIKTATTGQNFAFDVTRGFIFETRLSVDDATKASIAVGFCSTATNGFTYTDGFMFLKPAAATSFKFETQVGSAKTTSAVLGLPTTWVCPTSMITIGFAYKGVQSLVNGVVNYEFSLEVDLNDTFGSRYSTVRVPASAFPANTVKLMPTVGVLAGDANARVMTVDYVFAALERFNT